MGSFFFLFFSVRVVFLTFNLQLRIFLIFIERTGVEVGGRLEDWKKKRSEECDGEKRKNITRFTYFKSLYRDFSVHIRGTIYVHWILFIKLRMQIGVGKYSFACTYKHACLQVEIIANINTHIDIIYTCRKRNKNSHTRRYTLACTHIQTHTNIYGLLDHSYKWAH